MIVNSSRNKRWFFYAGLLALSVTCGQIEAQDAPSIDPVDSNTMADERLAEIDALEPAAATSTRASATSNARLETMSIIGNQELPKVLYIVPWKRSELGDLMGRPVNSLLDEVLAPVDRDVFRRYLAYYEELHPDQP